MVFSETYAADNRPEDISAYLFENYGEAQQRKELADDNIITLLVEVEL